MQNILYAENRGLQKDFSFFCLQILIQWQHSRSSIE